jgi:hypothetical protein
MAATRLLCFRQNLKASLDREKEPRQPSSVAPTSHAPMITGVPTVTRSRNKVIVILGVVLLFVGIAIAAAQIIFAFRQLDASSQDPFRVSVEGETFWIPLLIALAGAIIAVIGVFRLCKRPSRKK